jgi:hypothetical protein
MANPAAAADAEQHATEQIAGLRARLTARRPHPVTSLAAAAAGMVSGWLVLLRRKRRQKRGG